MLLGLCESSIPGAPEYSCIHLWYGSFLALYDSARRFDWKGELEETVLHELTHHWEHRAGVDDLDRFDHAQWQNFRRRRGKRVPPGFWRDGEVLDEGRWEIDGDVFVECRTLPPWTVVAGDGKQLECAPDHGQPWAIVPGRGALFDGARGDLVVAYVPIPKPGRLRRFLHRLRGGEQ